MSTGKGAIAGIFRKPKTAMKGADGDTLVELKIKQLAHFSPGEETAIH